MTPQLLKFHSETPVLMMPNAPSVLKNKRLDGTEMLFTPTRGDKVHISGISRDYHLYIMASRISSSFNTTAEWNAHHKKIDCEIIFHTFPTETIVKAEILFDGSSPYPIPSIIDVSCIKSVKPIQYDNLGYFVGLEFTYTDPNKESNSFFLNAGLMPFLKLINPPKFLTDFNIEYIGIACGPSGTRNVFQRANAHEKAVEIQADIIQKKGNRSLYIFAYNPEFVVLNKRGPSITTSRDMIVSLVKGGANSIYEAMEASLIAYFQPEYNTEFKDFPSKRPHWLTGKINSFDGIVLNINEIEVKLVSDYSNIIASPWTFGQFSTAAQPARPEHIVNINV
ncbi:hypothetical protein K151_1981 [Proteus hauseri ZMd44]|nr:hypothetical protein K151_1981 [Proteus hauseri ZMd44]